MSLKTGSRWSNWAWDKPVKAFIWRSSRICRPIGGLPPWFFEDSLPHLLLRNNSFSFMTLTTVGYGDITPVSPEARLVALCEAVAGVFFLAFLVARLVALYRADEHTEDH